MKVVKSKYVILIFVYVLFAGVLSQFEGLISVREFGTWGDWSTIVAVVTAYWGISDQLLFARKSDMQDKAFSSVMQTRAEMLALMRARDVNPEFQTSSKNLFGLFEQLGPASSEYQSFISDYLSVRNKIEHLRMQVEGLEILIGDNDETLKKALQNYAGYLRDKSNIAGNFGSIFEEEQNLWVQLLKALSNTT